MAERVRFINVTCIECRELQNKAAWQEVLKYYGDGMDDDALKRQLEQVHQRQGHG